MADVETIAQFQLDMAMESEGTALEMDLIVKGVSDGMKDPGKGTYYLVKNSGQVAGSLFLTKEWSDWSDCWYWWIQSVYVKPEFRRMGAYAALYGEIRKRAKAEGAKSLRLYVDKENVRAQKCYKSLGMDECHYYMYEESLM